MRELLKFHDETTVSNETNLSIESLKERPKTTSAPDDHFAEEALGETMSTDISAARRSRRGGKKSHRPPTFESLNDSYWNRVDAAKRKGTYISEYPPVKPGLDNPRPITAGGEYTPTQTSLPSLGDMLDSSKNLNRIAFKDKKQPDFTVRQVDEDTFKQRYAHEAVRVGLQYNINPQEMKNLQHRIYAFEDGGYGTHYLLSGMPQWMMNDEKKEQRLKYHPLSTAVGYNQLLEMNTEGQIRRKQTKIADRLDELAVEEPDRAKELQDKANLVRNIGKVLPRDGGVSRGLLQGLHALNLDGDIGPIIQTQEIADLLQYGKEKNFSQLLEQRSAKAEKDAASYDALPADKKAAAITEVIGLLKPIPIEGKPSTPESEAAFAQTKDSLAKRLAQLGPGLNDVLKKENMTDDEYQLLNTEILQQRRFGGDSGPLSAQARALLDKATYVYFGGPTPQSLMPAALELANLAGMGKALGMLQPENENLPTSNFFAKGGYQRNPVTSRRSSVELLWQINRIMHGPNSNPAKPGNKVFDAAFDREIEKFEKAKIN